MLNLLLPEWFNPWGWTAIAVVAALILILIIVLVIRGIKKSEDGGEEYVEEVSAGGDGKAEGTATSNANKKKVYHISKRKKDGKWQVKAAGAVKALKLFDTQAEAIDYAKEVAGNQEAKIMIHKVDGSFRPLTYK